MKKVIRTSVFETNSSSVHTLQISPSGLEKSKLKIGKDGMIRVPLRYYGTEEATYTEQLDKLSYLLSRVWDDRRYIASSASVNEEMHDVYAFTYIEDAIKDYTGCKGITVYIPKGEEPGIDHQSAPDSAEDMNGFCDVFNKESVQSFVFNKYVGFTTGRD